MRSNDKMSRTMVPLVSMPKLCSGSILSRDVLDLLSQMEENPGMVDLRSIGIFPCRASLIFRSLERFLGARVLCNVCVTIEKQTVLSVDEAPRTCYAPCVPDRQKMEETRLLESILNGSVSHDVDACLTPREP
jgi:hypothetical protein